MYCLENGKVVDLDFYRYKNEDELQNILYNNPEIILGLPDLELNSSDVFLVCRELSVSCGNIDLLIITDDADIVLVETKLLRNPESSRTVVAQIIDYIKTVTMMDIDSFFEKIMKMSSKKLNNAKLNDDRFITVLKKNIEKGNIYGLILGDDINPNLLEMISSIQSAPHLSFSLYLVSLETYLKDKSIFLYPNIVSKTNEVERSVINISIDLYDKRIQIESQVPTKTGKGTKPIISWDDFISSLNDQSNIAIFQNFYDEWMKIDSEAFNMGTVGFSAGVFINKKRIPIQLVYANQLELFTEKYRNKHSISDEIYNAYKEEISKYPNIYDKYLIANKTFVDYSKITKEELNGILSASIIVAKKLKETSNV